MEENYYTIFVRDGKFSYYVYDKFGRRHKRGTGVDVSLGAKGRQLVQQIIQRRISEGSLISKKTSKRMKFGEYSQGYWNYETCPYIQEKLARGGDFSLQVAKNYASMLERFILPTFGNRFLIEIDPIMIKRWVLEIPRKYNVSSHTANQALISMRHILESAVDDFYIDSNPAIRVKQLIVRNKNKTAFTPEQIKEMFSTDWDGHILEWTACYLSAATGMRLGEVRALMPEQVHTDYIEVNASYNDKCGRKCTKNGHDRIVPISSKVYYRLKKIMPEKGFIFTFNHCSPISTLTIYRPFRKRLEEMGIDRYKERLSFHSFRYYANTRLKASGIPEITVRAVLGHKTIQASMIYDSVSREDINKVIGVQEASI